MDGSGLSSSGSGDGQAKAGTTALDRFTIDLTEQAASGSMDPIVGRDEEIRQIIDVLMRRRQNNPILTGEAGVGKTAVVEGFAQRLASGDVPPQLQGVRLHALDIGLMQAGASMKGEFEQRLRSVIDEVQASPTPLIMFIDEAHTLVGAGGAEGTGDAANLLKPALARGTLRTIGATTWAEYGRHFEKDPALTRRFQPVEIDEPSIEKCCYMLRGILEPMEKHHGVRISDEAVVAAVTLSARYIPARQLPDKAVSLLDTACARVAISQTTTPAMIADLNVAIEAAQKELDAQEREIDLGQPNENRIAELKELIAEKQGELEKAEAAFEKENGIVKEIMELRTQLAAARGAEAEPTPEDAAPIVAESEPADTDESDAEAETPSEEAQSDAHAEIIVDDTPPVSGNEDDIRKQLAEITGGLQEIDADQRMIYAHVDEARLAPSCLTGPGFPLAGWSRTRSRISCVCRRFLKSASSVRITGWSRSPGASKPIAPSSTIPTSRSASSCFAAPRV